MVVHCVCVLIMCYTKFSGIHFVNYERIYSDVFIAGMSLEKISEHCLVVYVSEVLFCLELHITVSSFHLLPLHCIVHTQSSVCLHELSIVILHSILYERVFMFRLCAHLQNTLPAN